MLVLNRKQGEQIIIGDSIVITVIDLGRGRVRIGIEAPQEVPVHRHEVWVALQQPDGKSGQHKEEEGAA